MTAYATLADITALYGVDALFVADRDGNGQADQVAVSRALSSATDEINSYLAVRYPLPLQLAAGVPVPGVLVQSAVDIAVYRLALSRDVQSKEHRLRYEDALEALKALAAGRAQLVLASGSAQGDQSPAPESPQPVVAAGPERLFSRAAMRGL